MNSELRIDYVSPLPPVRSGIADYSRDLLPNLAPLCDLRVVRLPDQPVSEEIESRWHPSPVDELGADGRIPLYQMGNNRHHVEVWRLAHQLPGVLTLHDVVLHHLLIEVTLARGDLEAYTERLVADHGWSGEAVAKARQWTELGHSSIFGLPAHRTLLRRQRGVLVHSKWAAEKLGKTDPEIPVRVVQMGVPLPPPADRAAAMAWRGEVGLPPEAPLIGSFGFQTPIKRTVKAIQAMAHDALSGVHLAIGGEVSAKLDLEPLIEELGVRDRVHLLGFLDYEEFETAMAACDLCLNLRYPTAGETSASMLRELAVGRPVIVSDYAQFAEVPDEVAVKIPLGENEVEVLATTVGALLSDTDRLTEMGAAARRYIQREHDPAAAAAAVVEAVADLAKYEPRVERPVAGTPPTSLIWRTLPGEMEVEGTDLPWPKGEARRLRVHLRNTSVARWLSAEHEVGGVMVDLHWRRERKGPPAEQHWIKLPRNVDPGEAIDLEISLRRPLEDSDLLVVEPHLRKICGFNAVGGPSWEMELE